MESACRTVTRGLWLEDYFGVGLDDCGWRSMCEMGWVKHGWKTLCELYLKECGWRTMSGVRDDHGLRIVSGVGLEKPGWSTMYAMELEYFVRSGAGELWWEDSVCSGDGELCVE